MAGAAASSVPSSILAAGAAARTAHAALFLGLGAVLARAEALRAW
jgi:hypothetical protein